MREGKIAREPSTEKKSRDCQARREGEEEAGVRDRDTRTHAKKNQFKIITHTHVAERKRRGGGLTQTCTHAKRVTPNHRQSLTHAHSHNTNTQIYTKIRHIHAHTHLGHLLKKRKLGQKSKGFRLSQTAEPVVPNHRTSSPKPQNQ